MKKAILIVVAIAVTGILVYKFQGNTEQATVTNLKDTAANQKVFYLFHYPGDQSAGCRAIYALADGAERELQGRVKVLRPNVETETTLVEKYKIRVIPTIVITSPDGTEQERIEGEGPQASSRIKDAIAKLKESK